MPRSWFVAVLASLLCSPASDARTARDLNARIRIDGFTTHAAGPADTSEWRDDERLFATNLARGVPEESSFDSKWGADNDLHQIRVTWDKDTLYVAADAVISGNNLLVWLDTGEGGLARMDTLGSWRRAFRFGRGFAPEPFDSATVFGPDLFGATWDGNTAPQLQPGPVSTTLFRSSASFSGNLRGRAMEFAIPWSVAYPGATPVFVPSLRETVWTIPRRSVLRIAGAITAGGDGTGGPDSAPDKTGCHSSDASQLVDINNFARLPLDLRDDLGTNGGEPDGIPDWDVAPLERVSFRVAPPVRCVPCEGGDLFLDRPALAPHRGERTTFRFEFTFRLDPADLAERTDLITVRADVFDVKGRFVKNLYLEKKRALVDQRDLCLRTGAAPCEDVWDGRDERGHIVPPGVYVVRVVMSDPCTVRLTRPLVVAQ